MFGEKITDYIQIFDGVLSPGGCEDFIGMFKRYESDYVTGYENQLYKFNQLDVTSVDPNYSDAFTRLIMPLYHQYFERLNLSQYVDFSSLEDVRLKHYLKGDGHFRPHVDVRDHSSAKRYAIAIMYLNSNNGLTTFPNLGVGVKPEPGRVVIFPPTWMFPHAGTMPTDTDNYIIMTSLHYT